MKLDKISLIKDLQNKKALIPNALSASRLVAPFVIVKKTFDKDTKGVLFTAIGFALTDCFDGKLARKLDAETELGRLLDASADKVFSLTTILPMISSKPLLGVTATLEGLIAYINSKAFEEGNDPHTTYLGKIKTFLLSSSIILECLSRTTDSKKIEDLTNALLLLTAGLEMANIVQYSENGKKLRKKRN